MLIVQLVQRIISWQKCLGYLFHNISATAPQKRLRTVRGISCSELLPSDFWCLEVFRWLSTRKRLFKKTHCWTTCNVICCWDFSYIPLGNLQVHIKFRCFSSFNVGHHLKNKIWISMSSRPFDSWFYSRIIKYHLFLSLHTALLHLQYYTLHLLDPTHKLFTLSWFLKIMKRRSKL